MSYEPSCEAKLVEGYFELRFKGFASMSTEREYVGAESPVIACFGQELQISLYPGGTEESDDGMVAVQIDNCSNQAISLDLSLFITNSAGRNIATYEEDNGDLLAALSSRVFYNFASRTTLLGALVEGALVMQVRVKLVDSAGLPKPFLVKNPIGANMLKHLHDEESADVVFEVEPEVKRKTHGNKKKKLAPTVFHAHLFLIKMGAPMLYELCKSGGKTHIKDVTAEVFRDFLRYLYGMELPEDTLGKNAREFIDVADRYGAVHLKLRAEAEHVKTPLVLENAIDTLLYADAKNCALLKEAVMDFLVEHREEAMEKISFDRAPGYLMKDLLAAVETKYGKKDAGSNDEKGYGTMRVDALRQMLHDQNLEIDGSREAMIALLKEHS